jgi:predicted 2-oxoglutarate/Fe(II)-dependent dioxygenase YbiX
MDEYTLSDIECKTLIDKSIELDNWDIRKTNRSDYSLSLFDTDSDIREKIMKYTDTILGIKVNTIKVGVLRYNVGGYFDKHIDIDPHSDFNNDFIYNINVILNEGFEGGEFYVEDQPLPKKKGEIYHYRSDKFHEVKPVTKGVRYVALFYIRKREVSSRKSSLI